MMDYILKYKNLLNNIKNVFLGIALCDGKGFPEHLHTAQTEKGQDNAFGRAGEQIVIGIGIAIQRIKRNDVFHNSLLRTASRTNGTHGFLEEQR